MNCQVEPSTEGPDDSVTLSRHGTGFRCRHGGAHVAFGWRTPRS